MGGKSPNNTIGVRYIDRYSFMYGKKYLEGNAPYKQATSGDLDMFKEVLQISQAFKFYIASTESSDQFWKSFKDIQDMFSKEVREDLFFTYKVGMKYVGVPSKLVYILKKVKSQYKYPNLAMSSISNKLLAEFCYEDSLVDCTIADVVCNIWNSDVKLLSPYRRRAQFGDCVEIYVQNDTNDNSINMIALLPVDINSCIADNEVSSIVFDPKLGLRIGEALVRQMAGYVGITKHDFDLREVM